MTSKPTASFLLRLQRPVLSAGADGDFGFVYFHLQSMQAAVARHGCREQSGLRVVVDSSVTSQ